MRIKLSTKIIFMIGLVLTLGIGFLSAYVIRSENDLLFRKAYSKAEDINRVIIRLFTAFMAEGTSDPGMTHNIMKEIQFAEGEVIEIRLIHPPDIAKTFVDREIAERYRPMEEERPKDEIEREAIFGKVFRREAVVKIKDKNYRAIRFITPLKAEKRCLSCHTVQEGETMAALSSIISVESIHQVIQKRAAQLILLMGIVFIFTVAALYFFLHKIVVTPIGIISRVTKMIVWEGDLSKKVKIRAQDEVGDLADSFNKMTDTLQGTRDELVFAKDYTDNIIKSMIDTLIVVDPQGMVKTVNKATLDLLRYTEEELIGQPVVKIFEEELFKGKRLRRLIEEGSVRDFEMTYKTKSGKKIPVSFSGSVMYESTDDHRLDAQIGTDEKKQTTNYQQQTTKQRKIIGIVGVARDIRQTLNLIEELKKSKAEIEAYSKSLEMLVEKRTKELREKVFNLEEARRVMVSILEDTDEARKKLEKTLQELKLTQAQLIESGKLAGLGQMAAGVAHEINNPLTSIMGFAQLTMSRKDLDGTIKQDLQTIEKEAKRCVAIIENLLNFARPQEPQKVRVNINNVLEATLKVAEYSISREQINIVKKYQETLPVTTGDPSQLQQVFMNIILNATHAMPRGGTLTVETRATNNKLQTTGIAISFTDTGIGIPDENKEKIFEPFFTTSYKAGYKGTGLGLSISHSIIQQHGGRIEVESVVGKGSTFRVILPVVVGSL